MDWKIESVVDQSKLGQTMNVNEPLTSTKSPTFWSHPSVVAFANGRDPIETIVETVRSRVAEALDDGWSGPPFDPIGLAERWQIPVVACADVVDARTVPVVDRYRIEFNPNRPRGRIRYSLAHELAHTLFPDCHERVRNRSAREHQQKDDWQLEMLCNIGASEFLMPFGHFPVLDRQTATIERLMDLRRAFDVSIEAILLRFVRFSTDPCLLICCTRVEDGVDSGRYRIDYSVGSKMYPSKLVSGTLVPKNTIAKMCSAIGFTAKSREQWDGMDEPVEVQCVGMPPYPGHSFPRTAMLLFPQHCVNQPTSSIVYVRGDATQPHGESSRIIAHVVNNSRARWGAGFAKVVANQWPTVQSDFIEWIEGSDARLCLGNSHFYEIDENLSIVQMIAQRGYGDSTLPRIRYAALRRCLASLGEVAKQRRASIHMPRIGCGQAGGSWDVVSEMIDETLCKQGISVTVYDLPNNPFRTEPQLSIALKRI